MAMKKQVTPKRWRSKEAKEIVAAVQRAGGRVERTASGHLKVVGPAGFAVVASVPNAGRGEGQSMIGSYSPAERGRTVGAGRNGDRPRSSTLACRPAGTGPPVWAKEVLI
jgi:hypothetical protein